MEITIKQYKNNFNFMYVYKAVIFKKCKIEVVNIYNIYCRQKNWNAIQSRFNMAMFLTCIA